MGTQRTSHRKVYNCTLHLIVFLLAVFWAGASLCAAQKPSILFCSPGGTRGTAVNMTYIKELHAQGFEVDYTESQEEFFGLAPDRINKYNVLVIYITPNAVRVCHQNLRTDPELAKRFSTMIDAYVAAGGGVLLIPESGHAEVSELTDLWGAKITSEEAVETNEAFIGKLSHASYDIPLQYTDNIPPTPLSTGITGIWYPPHNTRPLVLDTTWKTVVKGSKTSKSQLNQDADTRTPGAVKRADDQPEPDLFAVRDYKQGRIALVSTMPQFSMGSGTQFVYNREVLSRGVKGKASDFGRLLENSYRWLAEPSLKSGTPGGYTTRESALVPLNYRAREKEYTDYTYWFGEYDVEQWHMPPKDGTLFKGLIGAHSAFSDGQGTVQEYKDAAEKAGLDFVVFLENFTSLTKAEYDQLVAECAKLSDHRVKLIPGFTARNNLGNYTMCIAEDGFWPSAADLTGPQKTELNMQPEESPGVYSGYNTGSCFSWMLAHCHRQRNIGFYNWADSGRGVRMPFQRLAAVAAIRYYKGGKLVEDMTDDYLTTLQSTMPPSPVSVNEVLSPAELEREVRSGNALTYGTARNLGSIMPDALRWSTPYDGMNVFLSDGPLILEWPTCYRPMTFGGEEFVTVAARMESPIHVTSAVGLKSITIYNGREVFRRFALQGQKEFREKLVLDGTIMKNLVLIAEDVKGGKATSFARRSYKYDIDAMAYCADHVNDYGGAMMKSFHGPGPLPVCPAPELPWDIAGFTWDGGPPARVALIDFVESRPSLTTDKGDESGARFNQYPITETSDEGMVAVASRQDEVFGENMKRVLNCWHTFGPHGDKSKLMEYTLRFKNLFQPTVGAPESDLPIRGVRTGMRPCVFRQEITFKQDFTVKDLLLLRSGKVPLASPAFLVIGRKPATIEKVINAEVMPKTESFHLQAGDWFAAFSPITACTHLLVVQGDPVVLDVNRYVKNPGWLTVRADIAGKQVKTGENFTFELASLNTSVDVEIHTAEDVQKLRASLAAPDKMQVLRGTKTEVTGYVDIEPQDFAAEVMIPRQSANLNMTLPLRIPHLNRNWSAGMWQKKGYVKGAYGPGENRWRGVGLDFAGNAHIPLHVDKADMTQVLVGHPVVADDRGKALAINVVHLFDHPHQWQVSVNNLTDQPVTTKLKQAMDLPNLVFEARELTLAPGEYRVLTAKTPRQ